MPVIPQIKSIYNKEFKNYIYEHFGGFKVNLTAERTIPRYLQLAQIPRPSAYSKFRRILPNFAEFRVDPYRTQVAAMQLILYSGNDY